MSPRVTSPVRRATAATRLAVRALWLLVLSTTSATAVPAATPAEEPVPSAIISMGQPTRWHPYTALSAGRHFEGGTAWSTTLTAGLYRDWIAAMTQGLGPAAELWGRVGGPESDAGARLYLASPGGMARAGLDQSFFDGGSPAFALGVDLPLQRGGLVLDGGQLRVDWIPVRNQVNLGLQWPLGSKRIGHTRPRDIDANLPTARDRHPAARPAPDLEEALGLTALSAGWLAVLTTGILWDDTPKIESDDLEKLRAFMDTLRAEIAAVDLLHPDGHTYQCEIALYHEQFDRVFGLAQGANWAEAPARGRVMADGAREALLESVLLPYNRAFGIIKEPDNLDGLSREAEHRFADWLLSRPQYGPAATARAQAAFRDLLRRLELVRARVRDDARVDPDVVWLPLQWGLRPDQFDSQAELDAILARAAGRPFTQGNSAEIINALQFAAELQRQVTDAQDYHVLWIHDYRGLNGAGEPDAVGYHQTLRYMRTLVDRVRGYDGRGRLPSYFIFLDQQYYDPNKARLWLDLLERPLDHRVGLGKGPYAAWADSLGQVQDELRAAVAGSTRLQAQAATRGGDDWIRRLVKVHVSITNPADLTFRSARMLPGLPGVPDAVARDHRKVAFYDLTEADPALGGALVTGTGIGEHYTSPTWEDRGLRVHGPGALEMKTAARRLLLSQGFSMDEIPEPLREAAPPADYDARVKAMTAAGWTASVLNVHNETGFQIKEATVANMILYTLAPPGTELWIPDSIWTSRTIAAALAGAALRGCSVLVIAPTLANAPSAGFPQMSRMRVMLGILVEYSRGLEAEIAAAGGRLRVGLYTRRTPKDDVAGVWRDVTRAWRAEPLMRDLFPFDPLAVQEFDSLAVKLESLGAGATSYAADTTERLPKMHRKTQFFGTGEAVRAVARDPETASVFRRITEQALAAGRAESGAVLADTTTAAAMAAYGRIDARLPDDLRARRLYYMTVGTVNKDARSNFLNGETQFVVSGVWGLGAYLDFLVLLANTEWLVSQEDLERHIPQYSGLQHRLGRFLRRVI